MVGEAAIESHQKQDSNGVNFNIGVGPIATELLKSNFKYSNAFKKAMVQMNVSGMAGGKRRAKSTSTALCPRHMIWERTIAELWSFFGDCVLSLLL